MTAPPFRVAAAWFAVIAFFHFISPVLQADVLIITLEDAIGTPVDELNPVAAGHPTRFYHVVTPIQP